MKSKKIAIIFLIIFNPFIIALMGYNIGDIFPNTLLGNNRFIGAINFIYTILWFGLFAAMISRKESYNGFKIQTKAMKVLITLYLISVTVLELKWYICALAAFPNLSLITLPIIAFIYIF